jgi:hypothetical protein
MEDSTKLEDLYSLKNAIESRGFQEYIMKPLYAEIDKQREAYDCESLKELWKVKGKKQGLMFLIKLLKEIDRQIKNTKLDIEQSGS